MAMPLPGTSSIQWLLVAFGHPGLKTGTTHTVDSASAAIFRQPCFARPAIKKRKCPHSVAWAFRLIGVPTFGLSGPLDRSFG